MINLIKSGSEIQIKNPKMGNISQFGSRSW